MALPNLRSLQRTIDRRLRRTTPYRVYRRANWLLTRVPGASLLRVPPKTTEWAVKSLTRTRAGRPDGLPTPRPTLRLGSQVAVDESILAVMMRPSKFPSRADYERVGTELALAAELYREHGWHLDPSGYHSTPPPLTDPSITEKSWMWHDYEHLEWESGYQPHPDEPARERWMAYDAPRTAHAWVLRHGDGSDRPWLIVMHGFSMGFPTGDLPTFRTKMLHEELGLNLAFPVMPMHGPRKVPGANDLLSFDLLNTVFGLTQATFDTRRLISWIRSISDQPIGAYGVSLGGYMTGLVSAHEDLDMAIAGIPAVDFPELFRHHAPDRVERISRNRGVLGPNATDTHRVISPLALPTRVPEGRRFIYAGLGDRMVPPPQPRSLWHHWDEPEALWYPGGHVSYLLTPRVHRFVHDSLVKSGFAVDGDRVRAPAQPAA